MIFHISLRKPPTLFLNMHLFSFFVHRESNAQSE